ncbi:MAG TPA: Crp/Fnr family transcriptional regulator, partial [Phnomibacter sp.]|nr:Crp/Fnr family transcriptional regulator [Phnomibacter sp.]
GVQRAYFETADGRQATILFTYPYSFSGLLDSFLLQKPSGFTLETLTQSQFLRCHYAAFSTLQVQYPAIMQMVLAGTAHAMSGVLDRLAQIQCYTAQEKFKALLTRSPHVLNLIPHKYLANYLGIDPATFSKLLAAVRL